MTPGEADTAPELGWTSSPGAGRRFPKRKVTRLLRLTQDHHRLHRRVQQDVILGGPRPDIRWPIPPRCMLGIARHPGHAHAEMTGDIAAAIPRVVGLNRGQHGQVRYECGHPDTVPKPERCNRRLTPRRQLPVQAGQRPAEDGTSLGLAGCPDGKPRRHRPARLSLGRGHSTRGFTGRDPWAHDHLRPVVDGSQPTGEPGLTRAVRSVRRCTR